MTWHASYVFDISLISLSLRHLKPISHVFSFVFCLFCVFSHRLGLKSSIQITSLASHVLRTLAKWLQKACFAVGGLNNTITVKDISGESVYSTRFAHCWLLCWTLACKHKPETKNSLNSLWISRCDSGGGRLRCRSEGIQDDAGLVVARIQKQEQWQDRAGCSWWIDAMSCLDDEELVVRGNKTDRNTGGVEIKLN